MMPSNQNPIPINQSGNLPSNESNHLSQANLNIPQSIYQSQMPPMTGPINSGIPISTSMNSMHHQHSLSGIVGSHTQPMMPPGHQQTQLPTNMGQQHPVPVRQPMIPGQHQQPMIGGSNDGGSGGSGGGPMAAMPYHSAPVHMGQYGAQQIPSQQVNPQPSAPNQMEQPKGEQPQVAELISFD